MLSYFCTVEIYASKYTQIIVIVFVKNEFKNNGFEAVIERYTKSSRAAATALNAKLATMKMKKDEHPDDFWVRCDTTAIELRELCVNVEPDIVLGSFLAVSRMTIPCKGRRLTCTPSIHCTKH